jgi:hypothetical protein
MDLSLNETRLLGVLIEKEITTPDQYPLSLNALTNGCNQKSNREPVMALDEATVRDVADGLIAKTLMTNVQGAGNRVSKLKHRFCNTEFSELQLTDQQLGIICVLFLRGAQSAGELRTRTNRLCEFRDVAEVETVLDSLQQHKKAPLVKKLPRQPGKRDCRYVHLFSGEAGVAEALETSAVSSPVEDMAEMQSRDDRISLLEQQVAELQEEIKRLKLLIE